MSLKSIAFTTAVATAVVVSTGVAVSPTQAASLTSEGSFNLTGKAYLTGTKFNPTLNFPTSSTTDPSSVFTLSNTSGGFTGLTGIPTIKSLSLTRLGLVQGSTTNYAFSFNEVPDFITGLKLDGTSVIFKLLANSLTGTIKKISPNPKIGDFNLSGSFQGVFTSGIDNVPIADGSFSLTSGATNTVSITAVPVPTPALLPGLLALGVGVLRKRKAEAAEEVQGDA